MESMNALPTVKMILSLAGILTSSPVVGFLPIRAFLCTFFNFPILYNENDPDSSSSFRASSFNESSNCFTFTLGRPHSSAMYVTVSLCLILFSTSYTFLL